MAGCSEGCFLSGSEIESKKQALASASLLATQPASVSPASHRQLPCPGNEPSDCRRGAPEHPPSSAAGHLHSFPPTARITSFNKYFIFSICNNNNHKYET